jgi:hypothetical protein
MSNVFIYKKTALEYVMEEIAQFSDGPSAFECVRNSLLRGPHFRGQSWHGHPNHPFPDCFAP